MSKQAEPAAGGRRAPTPAEPAPGRGPARALGAVCLAALAMPLSFTGPAVALPAIGRALGGGPFALAWVTNGFMLCFGSCLLAAGALADRVGRKRVFLAGNAAFAVASAGPALAPSLLSLDLLRAAQGVAAAASLSAGMAALAQEFDGPGRLRAFSLVGTSFGAGLALGPLTSGALVAAFGWRAILAPVLLCTVLACALGAAALRESRDPSSAPPDVAGALCFASALALLTFGALRAPGSGWADPAVLAAVVGAAALGAAFVRVERRRDDPLLDLSLCRHRRFVGVQLLAAAPAYGFVVLLVLLPIRMVGVQGLGEVAAGTVMMALSGPLLVLPAAAGRLARHVSPAALCGVGLLVTAAGLAWLSRVGADAGAAVPPALLIGAGISLPWGLMDGLAVSVVPKERAGMAAGIFNTTRVAGECLALAVVQAALSTLAAERLAAADPGAGGAASLAAQRLVAGDFAAAAAALPGLSREALAGHYGEAFAALLLGLAAVTAATAVALFLVLGRASAER